MAAFRDSPVIELRQYTLRPDRRDALVSVFEQHLVSGQEDVGMSLGGVFLDEEDADRFVWFRGFANLQDRTRALQDFYYGPVWQAHGDTANSTMVDSDDVLLLRPTEPAHPPRVAADGAGADRVQVEVWVFEPDQELERWLTGRVHDVLTRHLGTSVAMWRTHPGPNGFPALPVRHDHAVVWSATFADEAARTATQQRLRGSAEWRVVEERMAGLVTRRELLLQPTARSQHPTTGRNA